MPIGLQIALFIRFYGREVYTNSGYTTKDKIIPYRLFYFMSAALERIAAFEMSSNIQAISLGGGSVMAGKDATKVHEVIDKIWRQAMGEDVTWS